VNGSDDDDDDNDDDDDVDGASRDAGGEMVTMNRTTNRGGEEERGVRREEEEGYRGVAQFGANGKNETPRARASRVRNQFTTYYAIRDAGVCVLTRWRTTGNIKNKE